MASKVQADKRFQERRQSLDPGGQKTKHCSSNQEKKMEKEEEKIRAHFQRLENEKQRIKQHKQEEFQRRLSQQSEAAAARKVVSTDRQRNLSAHGQEDTQASRSAHSKSPGESKLFDYELSQPRSRRQLVASDLSSEMSRAGTDSGRTSEKSSRMGHRGSLPPSINVLPDLETRATGSKTGEAAERKVNFDENKLGADMRRFQRPRSKSISDPTKVQLPVIAVENTEVDRDTQKLKDLYNLAIERVKSVDEALLSQAGGAPGARMKTFSSSSFAKGFDTETLKELETILKDARIFSNRRSSREDHTRPDISSNRAQKKRIEHLERVLKQLKPEDKHLEFSPFKILQCSYLRLSKSNIETLEKMCREQGVDPGIHVHKDVTDYNIWEGLKGERRDSLDAQAAIEAQREERRESLTVPGHGRMRRESLEIPGAGPQQHDLEPPAGHNRQRRASLDVPRL